MLRCRIACSVFAMALLPLAVLASPHIMPLSSRDGVRTNPIANHQDKLQVVYTFPGAPNADGPDPDLAMDASGALYGVAGGGSAGYGAVYKLTPSGSSYQETVLYNFQGGIDGEGPSGKLLIGARGAIFGTTQGGGASSGLGCGTVYRLRLANGVYHKTTLFSFTDCTSMGSTPYSGVITDRTGALYGTTYQGGQSGYGTVFKLTPTGQVYTETVLHSFAGGTDGESPWSSVVEGMHGSLFGTTIDGGEGYRGVVYEMAKVGSSYTEKVLHTFKGGKDGENPVAPLIIGTSGILYGTTLSGGSQGGGTAFSLTPTNGGYTERILFPFSPSFFDSPRGGLLMDASGDLFGTTEAGGTLGWGTIYELIPKGTRYAERTLYEFAGQTDGGDPQSTLIMDGLGAIYGTTARAQRITHGDAFKLTPL